MDHAMETGDGPDTINGGEGESKDTKQTDGETIGDVFKKPAFFAAPSLSSKRSGNAAPSKLAAAETEPKTAVNRAEAAGSTGAESSGAESDGSSAERGKEQDGSGAPDKKAAPVKARADAKPRAPHSKGPPAVKHPPVPYTEPPWGGKPPDSRPYALEILKNGTIVDTVPLTQRGYFVVGRLPVCDVSLEHPSISRYHAVIQYRSQSGEAESVGEEEGFYVHDLGSTHGTVVNKNKIPPRTYIRLRVGHVLKFGGSTRLFILQGPEFDEEEESEFTVTELKERARKQREELEKRMMGGGSDDDDDDGDKEDKDGEQDGSRSRRKASNDDSGCSWGMAEEALPEEDENEENPFSTEFREDQEAAYLKDPKKALQGFYDREGEELELEYEDKGRGTWLCRIKLPVDDAQGRQLVAEVSHAGKKKEVAIQCCLEACRMLEARGLLRQEAVSRKRKKKNWEDEDYYDSDDDTFLDRTGTVEKKRQERMKKAGKIDEQPDTFDSLVAKLSAVEKELAETQHKLGAGKPGSSSSASEDPLDAFMTAVRSEAAMDAVERRKLHLHVADLRKDAQRLRRLVELTRPTQMPSLLPRESSETEKPKKTLPLFGAMKGGSKFKLKTGTIGKLPPKRPSLPSELFNLKGPSPGGGEVVVEEEEEEEEEEEQQVEEEMSAEKREEDEEDGGGGDDKESTTERNVDSGGPAVPHDGTKVLQSEEPTASVAQVRQHSGSSSSSSSSHPTSSPESKTKEPAAEPAPRKNLKKRVMGPKRPPAAQLSAQYPEDDPDYCVWVPPAGQTGDGRTALNDKYGY